MGLFRPSRRSRQEPDSMLRHKMTIFVIGAVVAMAGIASGTNWIIYIAVGILAVGVLLRFTRREDSTGPE